MVKFTVGIQNAENQHTVVVKTGDNAQTINIAPKSSGFGSSMNGAEALMLALATCYCNDIYREAAQRGISVKQVNIEVNGDFDGTSGHPIENIVYNVTVEADASQEEIEKLINHTDTVAEIQNTLRQGTGVRLGTVTANSSMTSKSG